MSKLYGILITLSLIWGTSFLFIKLLLEDLPPAAVVFGRCFFGVILLFGIVLVKKDKVWRKDLPWGYIILVALTNNVLPWFFISSSETSISSSLASILNATTPVWTLVIGSIFFKSVLNKFQWYGIFIGFLGIFLLSEFKIADLQDGNMIGIMLMSLAAICYGIGSQLTKKHLNDLTIMQISFFTLLFSSIISFIFVMITSAEAVSSLFHYESLLPLLGLGSLGSGVAYLLYYYLVTKGSPEFASFVTYLAPISAIIWGALLLKEQIHTSMLMGLIIIFIGVYISSKKVKGKKKQFAAD